MRWAGGKRWFTSKYAELFPKNYNTYIEAFLGSGSVFFHLLPEKAILGDINYELISTYLALKETPEKVLELLKKHALNHSEEYYYQIRNEIPQNIQETAARLIYLNRTCFNGIYRVNNQGKFNVPFGREEKVFLNSDDFFTISNILQSTEIIHSDFKQLIALANKDDFIFVDPPYTVAHNNNGFVNYNEKIFSWDDQIRLAETLIEAKRRGALILATNANHKCVRELYENEFELIEVTRRSTISASSLHRKDYSELVIKSY